MLLSGLCKGGPIDGRTIHHYGESVRVIGRDRLTKRLLIGWQGGPTEDVEVGHYEYSGGAWHWHSPNS